MQRREKSLEHRQTRFAITMLARMQESSLSQKWSVYRGERKRQRSCEEMGEQKRVCSGTSQVLDWNEVEEEFVTKLGHAVESKRGKRRKRDEEEAELEAVIAGISHLQISDKTASPKKQIKRRRLDVDVIEVPCNSFSGSANAGAGESVLDVSRHSISTAEPQSSDSTDSFDSVYSSADYSSLDDSCLLVRNMSRASNAIDHLAFDSESEFVPDYEDW